MKKTVIRIAAFFGLAIAGIAYATSEFRSPLSVVEGHGAIHYPLKPVRNTHWFQTMQPKDHKERSWCVDLWAATYARSANKAFYDDELDCDGKPKNKSTTKKVSLSTLWFGIDTEKEAFRGGEAFGAPISDPSVLTINNPITLTDNNVYLGFARIFPRFDYNEQGLSIGAHIKWDLTKDKRWHAGHRITIPFKIIEIEQSNDCKLEETLEDVRALRPILGDVSEVDSAYRLDFLSSLAATFSSGGVVTSGNFVDYGDGSTAANETKLGDKVLTALTPQDSADQPPAYATRKNSGEVPNYPYVKSPAQVVGSLAPDGSGGDENATLFFAQNTDYKDGLGQDKDAQGKLWIVPRAGTGADGVIDTSFEEIQDQIELVICELGVEESETAVEFFRTQCDIDLCPYERVVGLGDILTEWYIGYGPENNNYFADLVLGIRWPTGKKNTDPTHVYFQSTGHNRHFELKIGMEGGWRPCEWFALALDWSYFHAFERTEKKAAPFKGATVRNIGPTINAKVRWDYFIGHMNLNFFHPHNPDLGCVLSYEIFAKRQDRISLACSEGCGNDGVATDCLGQEVELDMSLLEKRTNSMTHKIRGEVFHRWNFFELFLGASQIIAGRNAMQETEAHLGVGVYF